MTRPRLAILPDFPEEAWPSMDLVAEMLLRELASSNQLHVHRVLPKFKHRLGFLGGPGRNIDRLLNRMRTYPAYLHRQAKNYDLFHLCDHSYSQVVHKLPTHRTGVFCHDLDTFRCLLNPAAEPRPKWFRAMANHILTGLQKAAVVFHLTNAVRAQILHHNLIDPAKLVHVPLAAASEFTCDPANLPKPSRTILHVGSCIPRKRIDVLLDTFARQTAPDLRLLQIGGDWTPNQREQIARLSLAGRITQLRGLTRDQIAQHYRTAAVVLQPSDAEGFGLPVVEALACGAMVLASDIPVLREVGADAIQYCPVGDIEAWTAATTRLLENPSSAPPLSDRLAWAARYSWSAHAHTIANAYTNLFTHGAPA